MAGPQPGRILFSEGVLQARIVELGRTIARDYGGQTPLLIGVLQGAFVFMADLVRTTPIELATDFLAVSSYAGTHASGEVRLVADVATAVAGRHVLLVEDIVDTGRTLAYLRETLEARGPMSLRVCALLDKRARRRVKVPLDYVGFPVPDVFVVGYGLDYGGLFRNLPYVAALANGSAPQRAMGP